MSADRRRRRGSGRACLCSRVRPLVSSWYDHEVTDLEDALVRAHLSHCPSCRDFLRATIATRRTVRSQPHTHAETPHQEWSTQTARRYVQRRYVQRRAVAGLLAAIAAVVWVGVTTPLTHETLATQAVQVVESTPRTLPQVLATRTLDPTLDARQGSGATQAVTPSTEPFTASGGVRTGHVGASGLDPVGGLPVDRVDAVEAASGGRSSADPADLQQYRRVE